MLLFGNGVFAADNEADDREVAKALPEGSLPLAGALKASMAQGQPLSAKYEIDHGALQLSVYTAQAFDFFELIIDYGSGAIKKSTRITGGEDLDDARSQAKAMSYATYPLENAVTRAIAANDGYRAIGVVPLLFGKHPVAAVTLAKGAETKMVSEDLD
jgi:hypothetical protein